MKSLLGPMAWHTFHLILVASLCVLAVLVAPQEAESSRDIPDNNLAYPVLILTDKKLMGSGFYLNAQNSIYLVTARHVLFDPNSGGPLFQRHILCRSYSSDPLDQSPNLLSLDLSALQTSGNLKRHATADVLAIRIGNLSDGTLQTIEGVEFKAFAKTDLLAVDLKGVKPFDQVLVGNQVFVFGYPVSIGAQQSPQFDYEKPLLRKGIIAGKNDKVGTLILDLPVYKGNSGGPVLEVETEGFGKKFRIVGVVVERVPAILTGEDVGIITNSGYSVAVSMNPVLELLSSFSTPLHTP
jgi:hypothetical protein